MTQILTYKMPFKRRLHEKTNYKKRHALLKANVPRAVIRKSNTSTLVQLVKFDSKGDLTVAAFNSRELKKFGWAIHFGNTSAAYLAGFAAGKKAKKAGVTKAVLDIGLSTPVHKSRIFAALKGLIDAGIEVPHEKEIFPADARIKGAHLKQNAAELFEKVKSEIEKNIGEEK